MSTSDTGTSGAAAKDQGISVVALGTALGTALVVFTIQISIFFLLRNKLARIFKPKTFMVPERERTDPPPISPWSLVLSLLRFKDREIIRKCGLDAYFFLRYLQMLLVIFVPIAMIAVPILIPVNYIGGLGRDIFNNVTAPGARDAPSGLDTLAWGNIAPVNYRRRWAHLVIAIAVIVWVCYVCFVELRVYIKVRQDYLTSAEHRLRASSNTVLVSSIPEKWLTEEALRGLFDVFPGGIRNIWLTRDFTKLLEKVHKRDGVRSILESAQTELIRDAKRKQLKRRKAEEAKERRQRKDRRPTKQEIQRREQEEDAEARRRAERGGGISTGDEEVPQVATLVADAESDKDAAEDSEYGGSKEKSESKSQPFTLNAIGGGLSKVGQGLKGGAAFVGKAGQGILGGPKTFQQGADSQLEHTGGLDALKDKDSGAPPSSRPPTRGSDRPRKAVQISNDAETAPQRRAMAASDHGRRGHTPSGSVASQDTFARSEIVDPRNLGNTTRKATNLDGMFLTDETRWWQFWKPPTGGYASPIPQGYEGDEFPLTQTESSNQDALSQKKPKSFWARVKSLLPFAGGEDEPPVDYPVEASNFVYQEERDEDAEWKKWLKASKRPTHRLPIFEWTPSWLPSLPLINKKVDTIYWCRSELARLNMEIEEDQKHPERYPVMTSAFIQFNNQVAAHMACQSVTHHVPRHMAPRIVEVSPNDVIWDNMAISWWSEWLRTFAVILIVSGMVLLWAFPVAFTSSLSQVDSLLSKGSVGEWAQQNPALKNFLKALAGVLPAVVLALVLALVPIIFDFLARFKGAKTGAQKSESVQTYYFLFLFVQVFLVVSISSGAFTTVLQATASNITSIPQTLAENLPKAANYFFSYMILQALSTSSGTLLQIGTLFVWHILARVVDNTARSKWARQVLLPSLTWGSFFPVYTNFACIALVYSVVAPLISLFAIITFSLLWVAHRYNMIYVTRFKTDTGGVLYPRAINQLFTGLYVMELCLVGLFFLVQDENKAFVGYIQAIIMIAVFVCTALYQVLLNWSFSPLFRYLPITFEDEAVLRDEAFQRAQDRRLGLADNGDDDVDSLDEAAMLREDGSVSKEDVELRRLSRKSGRQGTGGRMGMLNPVTGLRQAGSWAYKGGKHIGNATFGRAEKNFKRAATYRKERRRKDLEAQRAIGEALYGGYHDEIEDLTPEERDVLVREAFKHEALRARRPAVWIPRDDIGVSDDEIIRTRAFSGYIWISNEGAALDSKVRVIYGRAPPDFSDVELINL